MDKSYEPPTQITLLERLRSDPTDQTAWQEFVAIYGGKVSGWCHRWGLQEADSQDVTQIVLLKLASTMRDFTYDPSRSFRAYLKTLTRHALSDFLEGRGRAVAGVASGDSRLGELLQAVEAREDLQQQLEQAFDHEILDAAMTRVKARVAPQTWEAFRLTAIEGLTGAAAAERISMRPSQVFVAKRRVRDMLSEEVRTLEERTLGEAACPPLKLAAIQSRRKVAPERAGGAGSVAPAPEDS